MTSDDQDRLFMERLKQQQEDRRSLACCVEKAKQHLRRIQGTSAFIERAINWRLSLEAGRGTVETAPSLDESNYPALEEIDATLTEISRLREAIAEAQTFLDQIIPGAGQIKPAP